MERSVYLLDLLYSDSNQDCGFGGWIDMQINGYNRETRNRFTQIYTTGFFKQRCRSNSMEEGQAFQQTMLEQLDKEGEGEVAQSCPTLRPRGLLPTRLLRPWDSPGQNTRVDCRFLLQGIFPTQGSNPGLPHWGQKL